MSKLSLNEFREEGLDTVEVTSDELETTADAAASLASYMPGLYGVGTPTGALVADEAQLAATFTVAGSAIDVVPGQVGGVDAPCRVCCSRPVPVTVGGAAFHAVTFAASTAVVLVGVNIADVPNLAVGQFIYNAQDAASFAKRITVIADSGADLAVTLAAAYAGTTGANKDAKVGGLATASYATLGETSSAARPPMTYGGPLSKVDDMIIVMAETGSLGIGSVVTATRAN